MKHILFLLALAPALALAQTGTVKDSVRVLTTAEISAVNTPNDTTHVYFIQDGSWKKIRMDSLARFARLKLAGDRGDVTVSGADGLTWSVDNGAITGAKLATGAVDLTATTVTGTLPVSKGGTGNNGYPIGSIPFSNGTLLTSDTSNLFWNNSTKRLSIGNSTPNALLHVSAPISTGVNLFEMSDETAPGGYLRIQDYTSEQNNFSPAILAKGIGGGGTRSGLILSGQPGNDTVTSNVALGIEGHLNEKRLVNSSIVRVANWDLEVFRINAVGNVGIRNNNPTARLHLPAGENAASSAPLKFTSGTLRTAASADAGTMEYLSPDLYFTPTAGSRRFVNIGIAVTSATITPGTIAAGTTWESGNIPVDGASLGDVVSLGVQDGSAPAGITWFGWVSSAGNVKIRAANTSAGSLTPAANAFKIFVTKF
jgi:hypothetical protein